jgi:hypothetical protein
MLGPLELVKAGLMWRATLSMKKVFQNARKQSVEHAKARHLLTKIPPGTTVDTHKLGLSVFLSGVRVLLAALKTPRTTSL